MKGRYSGTKKPWVVERKGPDIAQRALMGLRRVGHRGRLFISTDNEPAILSPKEEALRGWRHSSRICLLLRKIAAHQNPASDTIAFLDTFLVVMLMNFLVRLNTSKSGDELISLKETCGPCEGRAEQQYYISVWKKGRTTFTTSMLSVLWLVTTLLSVSVVY